MILKKPMATISYPDLEAFFLSGYCQVRSIRFIQLSLEFNSHAARELVFTSFFG